MLTADLPGHTLGRRDRPTRFPQRSALEPTFRWRRRPGETARLDDARLLRRAATDPTNRLGRRTKQ